jgi:hypothetical protein
MAATGVTGLEGHIFGAKLFAQANQDPLLDEDEVAGVHIFTMESPFYSKLNSALASKNRQNAKPFFRYLRLVLGGLFKRGLIKGTFTRGIKNPNLQNYQPGRAPFFWWAFSSTTKTVGTTQEFLGNGPRMLFLVDGVGVDIKAYSAIPDEAEVLMLPGTFLKLVSALPQQGDLTIIQLQQQPAAHMVDFEHPGLSQMLSSNGPAPAPPPPPPPAPAPAPAVFVPAPAPAPAPAPSSSPAAADISGVIAELRDMGFGTEVILEGLQQGKTGQQQLVEWCLANNSSGASGGSGGSSSSGITFAAKQVYITPPSPHNNPPPIVAIVRSRC